MLVSNVKGVALLVGLILFRDDKGKCEFPSTIIDKFARLSNSFSAPTEKKYFFRNEILPLRIPTRLLETARVAIKKSHHPSNTSPAGEYIKTLRNRCVYSYILINWRREEERSRYFTSVPSRSRSYQLKGLRKDWAVKEIQNYHSA